MKCVITWDNKSYNNFAEIYKWNQNDDNEITISMKHNDDTTYAINGVTITANKLQFQNVLKEGDLIEATGTTSDATNGIIAFDLTNKFSSKGGNVYTVNYTITIDGATSNVAMGKIIIIE